MLSQDIPANVPRNFPNATSLTEWFQRRAARGPGRLVVTYDGTTWSYGELQNKMERLSAVLPAGGVRAGDRVAFLSFNHPLILAALFASARIGSARFSFRSTSG